MAPCGDLVSAESESIQTQGSIQGTMSSLYPHEGALIESHRAT